MTKAAYWPPDGRFHTESQGRFSARTDVTLTGRAGDHEIWYSPITQRRFPVDQKILSRHTANAVLKQASIAKQF